MQVSFALFADAANLSQEGKLNILGVFDALQVSALPAVHARAYMVVRLKGSHADIGTHTMGLRWLSPNGQELWSSVGELNVGAPPSGVGEMDLPLIAAIDLPLDVVGGYSMEIGLNNVTHAKIPLYVRTADMVSPMTPASGSMMS
ncbi:MAG: hypothetical protein M3081_13820 [Gemmatimonadota bacterium]|nr:hypothetical protein [Gemmatimonadota bacterium]